LLTSAQPCELIEPLTVGAVEFNEPPEHNAAGVEIAAIVGLAWLRIINHIC
jgi:hypothetical protein